MGVKEEHQNKIKSDREFEMCLDGYIEVMTRCTYLRANNGYTKEVAEAEQTMERIRKKLMTYLKEIRKEEAAMKIEAFEKHLKNLAQKEYEENE